MERPQEQTAITEELLSQLESDMREDVRQNRSLQRLAIRTFRKGGSPATASNYVKKVRLFCKWLKLAPDQALREKDMSWPALVDDYLDYMIETRKQARTSARVAVSALKKWLETNEVLSAKDLVWGKVDLPKYIRSETDLIPTRQQLRKIILGGNASDKALFLTATSSGLRRTSLLGLQMKHVDMTRDIPKITPPRAITKEKAAFFSFVSPEAKEALLIYFKGREMRGETLTPDSFVFTVDRPQGQRYTEPSSLDRRWVNLLTKSGLADKEHMIHSLHFHTLRSFFKTYCSVAGVNRDITEYLMGHRTSLPQTYFVGNPDSVAEVVLEAIEAEYRKALPSLTILSEAEDVELRKQVDSGQAEIAKLRERLDEERRKFDEDRSKASAGAEAMSKLEAQIEKQKSQIEEQRNELEEQKAMMNQEAEELAEQFSKRDAKLRERENSLESRVAGIEKLMAELKNELKLKS